MHKLKQGDIVNIQKERAFLIHCLYIATLLCLLYVFFRYLLYAILPFLIGFFIAFSLRPAVRHTISLFHLPQRLVSFFYLVLFYGTIGFTLTFLLIQGFHFLQAFLQDFPSIYQTQIAPALYSFLWQTQQTLSYLDPQTLTKLTNILLSMSASLQDIALSLSTSIITMITNIAASLPNILVSFFITILSSIFFAMDFPMISRFFMRQFSSNKRSNIYMIRHVVSETILNYLSAYGKLMGITFIELTIGLSYLQVEGAMIIAFIISFFDIFPILGTGTILFPWIAISFFNHHQKLAVGLLILHLIINLIRQIIEPKIVGKQMGLHPIVMLGCMFFGVKLFGILGIFMAPILLQIIQRLNHEGILHLYKE